VSQPCWNLPATTAGFPAFPTREELNVFQYTSPPVFMGLDNKSREKPIQVTTTRRVGGRKEGTVYTASLHFHLKYSAATGAQQKYQS